VLVFLARLAGTATPTPFNLWTPTPTPWLDPNAMINPTPTFTPTWTATPDPSLIPGFLIGRIGFMSDREGGKPGYYIMNPDGSDVQKLTGPDAYEAALVRDTLDPSGQYQAFTTLPRNSTVNFQINLRRLSDGTEWYLTGAEEGADYYPAYCQADPRYIAFTSQRGGGDDIFVVDLTSGVDGSPPRTTRLTENDWQWDKHPSWSADCKQIVFFTNRDGHDQIYLMDFAGMDYAGQNQRNLSNNPYNDWDPVWFKR